MIFQLLVILSKGHKMYFGHHPSWWERWRQMWQTSYLGHFTMHDIFGCFDPSSVPSNVYQGAHETEHSDHWLKGLQDSDNQRSHHWHHSEFKHYPKAPAQVDTQKRPPSLWVVSVSNTGHGTALVQFFPLKHMSRCPTWSTRHWHLSRIFPAARTFAWGLVTGYSVFAKIRSANLGWNVSFQVAWIVANFGNSKSTMGISDVLKCKFVEIYAGVDILSHHSLSLAAKQMSLCLSFSRCVTVQLDPLKKLRFRMDLTCSS